MSTLAFKKISLLTSTFGILLGVIFTTGRGQASQFNLAATPPSGQYTLTVDNTVAFNVETGVGQVAKTGGAFVSVTLVPSVITSATWSDTNKFPVTFSSLENDGDNQPPRLEFNQLQNIRTVSAVFLTNPPGAVNFRYTYLDITNNIEGGGDPTTAFQSNVTSGQIYAAPLKSDSGVGQNSYPDVLRITFPFGEVTLTSITITYDC
jgi:hypothetical protein